MRYGPVPTNSFSGSSEAASRFGMIAAAPLNSDNSVISGEYGLLSSITTVFASAALTEVTYGVAAFARADSFSQRCRQTTTSSAVITVPSWNGTFSRN